MRFSLRVIGLTFLRFFALLALGIFLQRFEVSPLPEWTLYAFGYAVQFGMTFFLTMIALRRVTPDTGRVAMVAVSFLVLGTGLEGGLYLFLTKGTWRDLAANYNAMSVLLAGWYVFAVIAGGWRARRSGGIAMVEGLRP